MLDISWLQWVHDFRSKSADDARSRNRNGLIVAPVRVFDKSLTVDDSEQAVISQGIACKIAVSSLERLFFWTVHLEPSAQKALRIKLLLDTRLRTLLFTTISFLKDT